jgi:DNA-binding response OmpR family regulator
MSTVTVHVKRLRSKLGDDHRIQTVWGRGYLWHGANGGDRAAQ